MFYRQLIYNYPEQLFADVGIMAIEHADFEGVERLALVTGHTSFLCNKKFDFLLNHSESKMKYIKSCIESNS